MERLEIDVFLTDEFWESTETHSFNNTLLDINQVQLPAGSILFQTSGSSGSKKWVVHTRGSLLESAKSVVEHLAIKASDNWLLALPIDHVGGFGILARSYYSKCRITHFRDKWCAIKAVSMMSKEQVTLCSLVPAQVVDIVNAELECPVMVRAVIVGGGKLDDGFKMKAISLGWPILESYGMTETGSQIATQLNSNDEGLSLISGWEAEVNSHGILNVRGKGLMKGYLICDESNMTFSQNFDDGWFETSDKVELNSHAQTIKFISRSDRTVKILGELVNLAALEAELKELTNSEILLVEISDERRGYILHPLIEQLNYEALDLDQLNLTGLHRLSPLVVCDAFPRNVMGKLDRAKLRELVVKSE